MIQCQQAQEACHERLGFSTSLGFLRVCFCCYITSKLCSVLVLGGGRFCRPWDQNTQEILNHSGPSSIKSKKICTCPHTQPPEIDLSEKNLRIPWIFFTNIQSWRHWFFTSWMIVGPFERGRGGDQYSLHLESTKQNYYILSFWAIIKAIFTASNLFKAMGEG